MNEAKLRVLAEWHGDNLVAQIELEGMIAENNQRLHSGLSPAYNEAAFTKLRDDVARNNNFRSSQFRDTY